MTTTKLEQNEAAIKRWRTRLKRAMTMLDKLEKQRKRLAVRASVPAHPTVDSETTLGTVPPAPTLSEALAKQIAEQVPQQVHQSDMLGDDIPAFLRRQTAPSPVAEAIRQEQAETKRLKAKGRIAKMKAKKAGDLKKMPLTGKAALAAIRG